MDKSFGKTPVEKRRVKKKKKPQVEDDPNICKPSEHGEKEKMTGLTRGPLRVSSLSTTL